MQREWRVTSPVRLLKIAPGKKARLWEECREGGYICVGWSNVGDLRRFRSREEPAAALRSKYYSNSPSTASRKAKELWALIQLEPGDQVVANKGIDKVVAVGTVKKSGYRYRTQRRDDYRHTVAVDWHTVYGKPKVIPPRKDWNNTTVASVSPELFRRLTGKLPPKRATIIDTRLLDKQEARERVRRLIVQREGQPEFRDHV